MANGTPDTIASRIMAKIANDVSESGFSVLHVMDETPFSYTVGFFPKFGYEMIFVGVPAQICMGLFHFIWYQYGMTAYVPPTNCESFKLHEEQPFTVMTHSVFDEIAYTEYTFQVENWYGRRVPIVQIVLSDDESRFPHEDKCKISPQMQPYIWQRAN